MSVHRYVLPPARAGGRARVRWRVNTELPPHADGSRQRRTRKGFLTKAEARAWEEVDNRPVWVDGAKSRAGERTVDLDEKTTGSLRTLRTRQLQERLLCGPAYQDNDLVVCRFDGAELHPGLLLEALHRHAKALDLPRITVHGLRHFYASVFLAGGGSFKVLQERLGHASAATTMDVYAHVSRDDHKRAAEDTARRITG